MSTESPSPIRVAVANDFPLVAAGVAAVLAPYRDRVAVVEVDSYTPQVGEVDLVLYDSFGQVQSAAVAVEELLRGSQARLVVFSWNTAPKLVEQALAAGAHGYVSKAASPEGLVSALRRVHHGEQVTPESDDGADGVGMGHWPGQGQGLTEREAEILALICQGLSNEQIGAQIFLGINTIKTYIRSLYAKIQVESRTQAVLWGIDHGFRPDRPRHADIGSSSV